MSESATRAAALPAIRPIREEEREQVAALFNNAYRIGMPVARTWIAGVPPEETLSMPAPDGRVASFLRIRPYRIWIGGREMDMGGIGGVATWADLQGHGQAGALVHGAVEAMRARGQFVSFLYPFSVRYYRKFGWECSGERIVYTDQAPSNLPRYEEFKRVRAYLGEADIPRIDLAYRAFAARYNGMAVRSEEDWRRILRELVDRGGHAYLIESASGGGGSPDGYFFCEHIHTPGLGSESRTHDFACASPSAWKAMIGFLSTLPTNVHRITLRAPAWPRVTNLFKEPSPLCRLETSFQFRVVDVAKAVEGRGFERSASGAARIAIRDEHAAWNEGVWDVRVKDGQGAAALSPGAAPDIELSIQQFSRLFCGDLDPVCESRQGFFPPARPGVLAFLRDAFHDRPVHLTEAF